MVYTRVFWSGLCSLEHIFFQSDQFVSYGEDPYQNQIQWIWSEYKKMFPESYDGKLVLLEDFENEEDLSGTNTYLHFRVSIIHYSTIIGLRKLHLPVKGSGIVGTQILIFNESKEYCLVGRRKYNQDYSPGLLTLPGGILEHEDIYNPTSSLLRELQEEVAIKFKDPQCIALLKEHTGYSTIILISVIIDQECDIHVTV